MRLRDYFIGQPVRLTSPHSPRMVADRINEAAGSRFWPFHTDAVVGGVWLGILRLRYVNSPFEYNAKPVLVGALRQDRSGSILKLRYRAPAWVYFFDLIWFGALSMVILMLLGLVGQRNPDLTGGDLLFSWTVLLVLLVTPLALHYFGTRKSDEELGYLLEFLKECVEAKH